MIGMGIAVFSAAALIVKLAGTPSGPGWVLLGLVAGGGFGAYRSANGRDDQDARTGGLLPQHDRPAAVFIAVAAVLEPAALLQGLQRGDSIPTGNPLVLFLVAAIGAITFSGSVIAFAN